MMHKCNWQGCPKMLPRQMYACRPHWGKLPTTIQREITNAWNRGDSGAWIAAHDRAQEWIESLKAVKLP